MSLMFAALKTLESPAAAEGGAAAPAAPPAAPARRWLWPALAVGGGLLLAGGWLWATARPAGPQVPPAQVAIAPAPHTIAEAGATTYPLQPADQAPLDVPPPAVSPEAAAPLEPAEAEPSHEAQSLESPGVDPEPMDVEPRNNGTADLGHTPGTREQAQQSTRSRETAAAAESHAAPATAAPGPAPTAAPDALVAEVTVRDAASVAEPQSQPVAQLVAAIGSAIHAGDIAAARAQLAQLEVQLPPRSLTLLRMQAWVAHEAGDTPAALALYRQIVERMPRDQTAAINLAILEAGNGQPEAARERLGRLRALDPDSRAIERAIQLVEASLR